MTVRCPGTCVHYKPRRIGEGQNDHVVVGNNAVRTTNGKCAVKQGKIPARVRVPLENP